MMKSRTVRTTCACISRGHELQSLYPKVKHDLHVLSFLLLLQVALSVVLVAWFTNTETFHNMLTGLSETTAPTSQPEMSATDHLNLPHLQQVLSAHVGE